MTFWKDHFDHLLLVLLGILGAVAGVWCTAHHFDDASKWLFAQAAASLAALLMRMNARGATPEPTSIPTETK